MASFQTPLSLPSAQRDDNSGYRCASKTEPRPRLRRLDLRDRHRHWADYGPHYLALATTVWASLIGVVGFGATIGSMLPFALRRIGFDRHKFRAVRRDARRRHGPHYLLHDCIGNIARLGSLSIGLHHVATPTAVALDQFRPIELGIRFPSIFTYRCRVEPGPID